MFKYVGATGRPWPHGPGWSRIFRGCARERHCSLSASWYQVCAGGFGPKPPAHARAQGAARSLWALLFVLNGWFGLSVVGDLGAGFGDLLRAQDHGLAVDPGAVVDLGHLLQDLRERIRFVYRLPQRDRPVVAQQ